MAQQCCSPYPRFAAWRHRAAKRRGSRLATAQFLSQRVRFPVLLASHQFRAGTAFAIAIRRRVRLLPLMPAQALYLDTSIPRYLDTSVIGGYYDTEFLASTRALWRLMERGAYRFYTSRVAMNELRRALLRMRRAFSM